MEPKVIMMAALGRALYPGMLYDCRSDSYIPGVTLWDKKALRDDIDVHDQAKTYVKLAASDSLSEKSNLLDVSASVKASFLGGLIEVGGSAKYLNDVKSSVNQCRVTMQFSQTTVFEQLTMKELGNIAYPQVFDQKTATHVVTAVLYGASAFMVFDYTKTGNESKQAIEGNLQAVVKKIPTLSVEGQASLKMNQDEKKLADNISVTFYGDYELDENPTTYSDALKACKSLPSLLKDRKSKGVPVTVWLYPLSLLNSKAAKLTKDISLSLVCKTETLLEELNEVERKCNDLVNDQSTFNYPPLKDRLLEFRDLQSYYKVAFQKALVGILPAIRDGTMENKALGDLLNIHYSSPFSAVNMSKWLDNMKAELYILNCYTSGLKDLPVVTSSGSFNSILFDPDVEVVLCLSFTSLNFVDPYLGALQDFVNSDGFSSTSPSITFQSAQPWFTLPDISGRMRQNVSLFTSFFNANKTNKRIKFFITPFSDPNNPGNSIQLYQNGVMTDPKFNPVSKPSVPVVEISSGKVNLKLSKPTSGDTVRFRIEYKATPPTDSATAWTVINTSDAQGSFTLTGLKPAEQYWVQYRAVNNVGISEASDCVPVTFTEKLDVSVDQWNFSMPSFISQIRNKIMTNVGMSRWSVSTIKSEVTNIINSPSVTYSGPIPGGIKPGMALYFQGTVLDTAVSFEINLMSGPRESNSDIICHTFYHITDGYINYNTCKKGVNWDSSQRMSGCPLTKGSAFDIFFVAKNEGYEVYINGQKNNLFANRMPMDKVTTLQIYGDVTMNLIGTVPNWNASTFNKEMSSGSSRSKGSNIQTDVPQAVCNPRKLYFGKIPGALKPGVAFFFQGVIPSDFDRFDINLMTSPRLGYDTAFHFNPRINSLVRNSCRNGQWEDAVETAGSPFVKGGSFDIIMFVKSDCYEVIVNGLPSITFNHRISIDKVNSIQINGDVFMNSFGFLEMDNIKMKAIIPANI